MQQHRRKSRPIKLSNVQVGGGAPVNVQSMTNTDTRDAVATLRQIHELSVAGCEIVRVAVPDEQAVAALPEIIGQSAVPVIADIHFDCRLALGAIAAGIHGIRLNPGNIGSAENVRKVAEAAGEAGISIRVGANSGSLAKKIRDESETLVDALFRSALEQCRLLEKYGFTAIKVSLKSSDVPIMVAAYRKFAAATDYPLHLGVTEAGTPRRGVVKSAIGIGSLLLDGIGDTIRVSLTSGPVEEVICGSRILESCGLRPATTEIISCPTCGRTTIDLIGLAERVEEIVDSIKASGRKFDLKKIAVMGCAVNGPGEARDADLGIAGADGRLVAFRHGQVVSSFDEPGALAWLRDEILKHTS